MKNVEKTQTLIKYYKFVQNIPKFSLNVTIIE